jgi:DNA-binding protein H-NS
MAGLIQSNMGISFLTDNPLIIHFISRIFKVTKTSNPQIQKLEKQLAALKKKEAAKQASGQKRALDRILKIAKDAGMDAAALVAALGGARSKAKTASKTTRKTTGKKSATAGTKVAPKYRNPADASQTWTGRGKSPLWVAELKKAGKLDAALIK